MPPRKRARKRKRRDVSSSSSSSSDGSSNDDEKVTRTHQLAVEQKAVTPPAESDSSSESDTDSSTSSEVSKTHAGPTQASEAIPLQEKRVLSRSPTPVDVEIPPMFPPPSAGGPNEKEKALREKFKKFWMSSVANAFKEDLEEIRKEHNLTTSRLSLFIDALASGADVYASNDNPSINEMEMVLENSETSM